MNQIETEKLVVRLFDKKFVSAIRVTGMRAEIAGIPSGVTVDLEALLLDGGAISGSLNILSQSISAAVRAEVQIKRIKEIKKKKEENLVNFMDELRSVEDE